MNFTDVFIKRPVFATVLSLIILLVGARAYFSLPTRQYPKIDEAAIDIKVSYPGASADLMEGFVTTPVENAISGVEGIDYISSSSTYGNSEITLHFNLGQDIDKAMADVNSEVASVRWKLPKDVYDPVVHKLDPNSHPSMYLAFSSTTMSGEELTDYLERVVQPQLQVLSGVGQAQVWSGNKYGMRIWLNPYAMAARNITASDIINSLNMGNIQAPSGTVKTAWQEFNINTLSDINTAKQFNELVLRNDNGQLTRIQDVGRSELGSAITNISVNLDGKPSVMVAVTPQINANPLDVSKVVNANLVKIQHDLPQGIHYQLFLDTSDFIAASIWEVKKTVVEAAIFVIIIVFLFLGSGRVLLIPAVTMPLSIIGVFGVMLAMSYSLNTLTFLALVLAIGMVVDDAIVVSENIYRHISMGKTPYEAALEGAREIQFAIISITLTLAAVYAPIGFMTGLTGALFKEFAFTLASAVVISGFIALTLTPMMCSKIMRSDALSGKFAIMVHDLLQRAINIYGVTLTKVLRIRIAIIVFMLLALGACYWLFASLASELAPREDQGWVFSMISGPAAANIDFTEKYTRQLIPIFKSVPELEHYGIVNGDMGTNTAESFLTLQDWSKRKRNVDQIIQQSLMFPMLSITGVTAYPVNPFRLPGASSWDPIEIAVQTTGSYEELNAQVQKLVLAIRANQGITNVDTDLKLDQPQLDIKIDRNRAGDLGISMSDIAYAINLGFGAPLTTHINIAGRSYDVMPEFEDQYRSRPDFINSLQLRTAKGDLVPLSNIVTIKESIRPRSLNHFQQMRYAKITADLAPDYALGEALNFVQNTLQKIAPDMKIDYSGQSRQFIQASGKMGFTFAFAMIFIFLVLAAQFESFRDPFIVMFTVPLSTLGALVALHFTGGTLNIYSEIGLVTLVGLISKHGILMVEFANQLREQGRELREAIIEAASIRLRPILMTTGAMILGALPLALAHGAGAASRQQIGWVVIGGMSIGTLFTLFVVPTMYTYISKKKTN